jgi:hypothetical protein
MRLFVVRKMLEMLDKKEVEFAIGVDDPPLKVSSSVSIYGWLCDIYRKNNKSVNPDWKRFMQDGRHHYEYLSQKTQLPTTVAEWAGYSTQEKPDTDLVRKMIVAVQKAKTQEEVREELEKILRAKYQKFLDNPELSYPPAYRVVVKPRFPLHLFVGEGPMQRNEVFSKFWAFMNSKGYANCGRVKLPSGPPERLSEEVKLLRGMFGGLADVPRPAVYKAIHFHCERVFPEKEKPKEDSK